jgi:hypothetical protein
VVNPWPRNNLPWGFTSDFFKLGATFVAEEPANWDNNKIILNMGSTVVFKFVHVQYPLLAPICHLYDYKVMTFNVFYNAFLFS